MPDPNLPPSTAPDDIERLRRLGELHAAGVLTDKEFASQKAQILGGRDPWSRGRKLGAGALVALALVGIAAGGVIAKSNHDDKVARENKAKQVAEVHRLRVIADRRKASQLRTAEIQDRQHLVLELRKSVTKDFRSRVADGELEGPILHTTCDPVSGGVEDLDQTTGQWSCLASSEKHDDGSERGYSVTATINYTRGTYTWQLGR